MKGSAGFDLCSMSFSLAHPFPSVSIVHQLQSLKTRSKRLSLKAKSWWGWVVQLLSSNPDVLASPLAGGFICQSNTGATYSSCLFSPLVDVSTSSGMHSSCFAHVTNVCLAVCQIKTPSFFFLSIFSPQRTKPHKRSETEDRQELLAISCNLIRACF